MAVTGQQTSGRRWVVLAIGVLAQTSACAFIYGVPFLVPDLRDQMGLSLAAAGTYVAAPTTGLLATLIAWGAAADRFGERKVMASGLLLAGLAVGVVALTPDLGTRPRLALFAAGGAAAASVFAASGRMIMGWFPRTERGLAMGIRQTAQPLGVAVAGLVLPGLAQRTGPFGAMVVPAALCLLSALLVIGAAPDPVRPPRAAGRAHGLALPHPGAVAGARGQRDARGAAVRGQRLRRRVPRPPAGLEHHRRGRVRRRDPDRGRGVAHRLRACGRTGWARGCARCASSRSAPRWCCSPSPSATPSRRGSRSPRWPSAGSSRWPTTGWRSPPSPRSPGSAWSGRALGIQNTGQNVVASLTPIVLGALVGAAGYAVGFAVAAVAPVAAVALTPVRDEPEPSW